jgi:tetratricopeptide (TPR) repeat protein
MQKILLLLFFFLLTGCALNRPFSAAEVDKVYIVKYDSYVKYHRAYFTRTDLKPMQNGKKYLYLYHAKKKDLAILLHRKNQYQLYSLTYPDKKEIIFNVSHKTKYNTVLRSLKRKGYRLTSPTKMGYISRVSLQRYKGIKTLLVEMEDYSRLQEMYKKAIKTYDAKNIKFIKTKLPKELISSYYEYYHKRAKTQKQLKQLQIIAEKLQKVIEKEKVQEEEVPKEVKVVTAVKKPKEATKPYSYYLKSASYNELNTYLSKGGAKDHLTYNEYNKLKEKLKEEKLLQDGSLEEVISAYKKNKDPRYKTRSLELMKKAQENK